MCGGAGARLPQADALEITDIGCLGCEARKFPSKQTAQRYSANGKLNPLPADLTQGQEGGKDGPQAGTAVRF